MKKTIRFLGITLVSTMILSSCHNNKPADAANPFFSEYKTPFGVPPFEQITPEHYMPAFEKGMNDAREELKKLLADRNQPTFENTIEALDRLGRLLSKVSNVFFNQAQANTNDSLQSIEVEISPKLAAFQDEVRLNPELFARVKSVYDNQESFKLTDDQKFLLENLYKAFIRNGANLSEKDQDTLKVLNQKLSVLTVKYSQNILSETNNYRMFITDRADLAGLPEPLISAAADEARAAGFEGKWAFTTKRPSIFPFLTYSEKREKREELYRAYLSRGNNNNEFDNKKLLSEIIRLRAQRAKLLGYRDHSSIVLETRMAGKPENVFALLNDLWVRAIAVAKKDREEMQKIIKSEGENFRLEAWDWWYYAEKLRMQKFNLDDNELRPYFMLENVIDGVFGVANRLFGITLIPVENIPLPHPEAMAYEVKESDGTHLGILYLDFHPRTSKQQGAWCGTYRSHHIREGKEITPVVTTVYNFTRATGDTPALLSLEEVSTFFHEFGHALDNLFNKARYNQTYIAWDFVELPSQIMEHWATEPEVLKMYAKHYKTGAVIPDELIGKIEKSGYFNQGFETVEYLAASLLDMSFHTLESPENLDVMKFEEEYLNKIGLIPEIAPRYRSTYFLHIAGGYDAGYYSYIWAAVLDNDAFEAFREKGIFDKTTAESLRRNILEKNGTMDAMQMFINFRGRQPVIEPLLKNRGLD